ncbi:hypothetical protein ALC56_00419 [Trachymyrmex septentrionalis]|uniref:Uncharacterized protein n=1 Tax=Trachymyrmex septentrionalis TaxID=34720 RepID=A0A195FZD7_9HYME|nr:hypothetical protein ALC56_00419 [Trachymyrmex septentrionalis]
MPCEIIRCTVEDLSEKYPFTRICGTANGILRVSPIRALLSRRIEGATFGTSARSVSLPRKTSSLCPQSASWTGITLGIKTARFNPFQLASSSIRRRAGAHFSSPSSKKQKPLVTILMVTSASLVIPAVGGTG